MKILYHLPRLFISLILLFSGIAKLIDPEPTINLLSALHIFPDIINNIILLLLPAIELGLASLLLSKFKTKITNILCNSLFFAFFVMSVYLAIIGIDQDCGCFGSFIQSRTGWLMVIRNMIFLFLSSTLFLADRNKSNSKQKLQWSKDVPEAN